jgi:hypothetical protein
MIMNRLFKTVPLLSIVLTLILSTLIGCQSLGLAPAQSLDQKIAYAYGTHTAVLEAATSAVNSDRLSIADAQQVLILADQSKQLLDAGRIAERANDTVTANSKITLATTVLAQLQTYLNSHITPH